MTRPPNPFDETSGQQRAARTARAGQDGRLDRPQAPVAEMIEGLAVRVRYDEPRVAFRLRPVERKRDLVRLPLHSSLLGGCVCGVCGGVELAAVQAAPAAAGVVEAGGSDGGPPDADDMRST